MNFFLKKDIILQEVDEWIAKAKTEEASYGGLTNGHNYEICSLFQNDKDKYHDELVSMRKELVEEFEKLTSPWPSKEDMTPAKIVRSPSMVGKGISSEDQVKINVM